MSAAATRSRSADGTSPSTCSFSTGLNCLVAIELKTASLVGTAAACSLSSRFVLFTRGLSRHDPAFHKADGSVDEDRAGLKRADLFNFIEKLVMCNEE